MSDVETLLAKVDLLKSNLEKNNAKIENLVVGINAVESTRKFLVDFTEESRKRIKDKLENLANSALKCVFSDKEILFQILPNKQKRGVQYDLYVRTDGELTPLNDAKGGGVLDVITMALRISFLRLFRSKIRQVLFLDEPFKNLDSFRIQFAIKWLALISQEFEMQFVVVTHIQDIVEECGKVYRFELEDGVTKVSSVK